MPQHRRMEEDFAAAVKQHFDHSKTKFPLEGKHATVDCGHCHANGDFKKPLAFAKCMDCHKDPAQRTICETRRTARRVRVLSQRAGMEAVDVHVKEHASTYPLRDGHARLECAQCHIPKGKDTLFKVNFDRCTDCHRDEHKGQFAAEPYLNPAIGVTL